MIPKFNVTHVGGRGGTINFPKDTAFNDNISFSIFEADHSCIEQIKRSNPLAEVYPFCIGSKEEEKIFNINLSRYASSFLEINSNNLNFFSETNEGDKLLNETTKTINKIKLKTYSLDYLVQKKIIPDINFLSLDTQGSEYDILKGSIDCLKNSIVAVATEVSLVEIYKDSKLFFDIDKLLRDAGFFLTDFIPFNSFYSERVPLEFRGKKIPLQGEALYFLNPDNVKLKNKIDYVEKLENLAFAFVVYGFIDLAFRSLNLIYRNNLNFSNANLFQKFLKEFYFKVKSKEKNLPKLWHENFSQNYSIEVSKIDEKLEPDYFRKNIYSKALYRLLKNPLSFFKIFIKYILNKSKFILSEFIFIKIIYKKKSKFSKYLKKYKLFLSANRINSDRVK